MASEYNGIADRHSGTHGQIGMAANSACGAHEMSDSATHKTSAGTYARDDAAMHTSAALVSSPVRRPSNQASVPKWWWWW